MQCLPPALLFISMIFLNESPRWLARTDRWERSTEVLSKLRNLPPDHPYIQGELLEMRRQLEEELASVNGGTGFTAIWKEMFTVPGNRRRAFLSMGLMCAQQWTGTNAINYVSLEESILVCRRRPHCSNDSNISIVRSNYLRKPRPVQQHNRPAGNRCLWCCQDCRRFDVRSLCGRYCRQTLVLDLLRICYVPLHVLPGILLPFRQHRGRRDRCLWLRRTRGNLPVRRRVSARLGPCMLDIRLGNPNLSPQRVERRTCGSYAMAFQLCRSPRDSCHAQHRGRSWLRYILRKYTRRSGSQRDTC